MLFKRLLQVALFLLLSNLAVAGAATAPSGLTAEPYSIGKVLLRWTAADGTPMYTIERSLSATGGFVAYGSTSTLAYLDGLATPGTTYYYRARAVTGSTVSAYSNVASATPVGATTTTTLASTTSTTLAPSGGPVANAGPDQLTQTLTTITLTGSGSAAVGATIREYTWSFGDGGIGSGRSVTHAYSTPGTFTATLTVTDSTGLKASDTATVSVANRPPSANAGPDQTQTVGSSVTLRGSASDLDGTISSFAWSFGDGAAGSGATMTHAYAVAGTYTATLAVTDDRGARATDTALVTITGPGSTPVAWALRFGSVASDLGYGVAVDGSGNVVMTGHIEGAGVDFGGGLSCPGFAIPVVKFSATGTPLWCRCASGDGLGSGEGTAVAVDGSGNVVVTGKFGGTADFGGGPLTSVAGADIFVAKYSATGAHLWSRRMGSSILSISETATGVAMDGAGSVVVIGTLAGPADLGGGLLPSGGLFVVKYSPAGNHLWSKNIQAALGRGVAVDVNGNVVVTGQYGGTVDFGVGLLTSPYTNAMFVTKYSAAGTALWSRSAGGWIYDTGNAVAVDSAGNVVVTGKFGNLINFGNGWVSTRSANDGFLVKYDPAGTLAWARTFGGPSDDSGNGVATDAAGNVVVTGGATQEIDFGGGPLVAKNGDVFVAKFSPAGTHVWSRLYGGDWWDQGNAVTTDRNGSVVVTGSIASPSVDFGAGPLLAAGAHDIFLFHGAP